MNYDEMSDFEINRLVTEKCQIFLRHEFSAISNCYHRGKPGDNGYRVGFVRDYCNNPSDAWPIIVGNNISLLREVYESEWMAMSGAHLNMDCELGFEVDAYDEKPLRAAMICFLGMEDSENAN